MLSTLQVQEYIKPLSRSERCCQNIRCKCKLYHVLLLHEGFSIFMQEWWSIVFRCFRFMVRIYARNRNFSVGNFFFFPWKNKTQYHLPRNKYRLSKHAFSLIDAHCVVCLHFCEDELFYKCIVYM